MRQPRMATASSLMNTFSCYTCPQALAYVLIVPSPCPQQHCSFISHQAFIYVLAMPDRLIFGFASVIRLLIIKLPHISASCQLFTSSTAPIPHFFSPLIVATIFLECLDFLNSRYQIPCHVPKFNLPSLIGTLTLTPTNAALTCAGISSKPSALCLYKLPFRSSGTMRSSAALMSVRTSSS